MVREKVDWNYMFEMAFWLVMFIYYCWFNKADQDTFIFLGVAYCVFQTVHNKYKGQ